MQVTAWWLGCPHALAGRDAQAGVQNHPWPCPAPAAKSLGMAPGTSPGTQRHCLVQGSVYSSRQRPSCAFRKAEICAHQEKGLQGAQCVLQLSGSCEACTHQAQLTDTV